jgi:hypothetical protein
MSKSLWAVVTKIHRQGGLNNKHLFLMVLEAGNSELKRPAGLVSGNELFSASKVCLAAPSRRDECFVLREGTEE